MVVGAKPSLNTGQNALLQSSWVGLDKKRKMEIKFSLRDEKNC